MGARQAEAAAGGTTSTWRASAPSLAAMALLASLCLAGAGRVAQVGWSGAWSERNDWGQTLGMASLGYCLCLGAYNTITTLGVPLSGRATTGRDDDSHGLEASPDDDGLLADASVQQLVRDATAAAAANRGFARPAPGAPPAPSRQTNHKTNACPMTGYLGFEGEARMSLVGQSTQPDRKWFTFSIVVFLALMRAWVQMKNNAQLLEAAGREAEPNSSFDLVRIVCMTLVFSLTCAVFCQALMMKIVPVRSQGPGMFITLLVLLHMPLYLHAYSTCGSTYTSFMEFTLKMPWQPMLCTLTESGNKTLRMSPLIMLYTTACFAGSGFIDQRNMTWKAKLTFVFVSQVLTLTPHMYFVAPEVAWVLFRLLAANYNAIFVRLYLLERRLRLLFLIETEIEFDKQRHFFSMQGQLSGKLSRVADISWYLKTIPFDPQIIRAGVAQMKKDNKTMTDASSALKAQLATKNGKLAPITADSKSASCPFQGWCLTAEQNDLLDDLYKRHHQQTESQSGIPVTQSGSAEFLAKLPFALCTVSGVLQMASYVYSTRILPPFVAAATIIILTVVSRAWRHFRSEEQVSPLARQFGAFLVLASSAIPLVVLMPVIYQWNPEDIGNFEVDVQYLYTLVMFVNSHTYYRIHLQMQHGDLPWLYVFIYNYGVGLLSWLVFMSKLWGHPCLWPIQACVMFMMCSDAMASYDNEALMRRCFLAQQMNKQVQADAFYTVMHDINQPLNGIANCCDLLLMSSKAETAEVLNLLQVSVSWQTQLLESGRMQEQLLFGDTAFEPSYCDNVNIKQLVAECMTIGNGYHFGGGLPVVLKYEISTEVPSAVNHLDVQGVKRFILNLVSNAIKFTLSGTITISVKRAGPQPGANSTDGLCFSVADTGSGIPADKVNLLFSKFSQLHDEDRGGTGLGLWSMKKVVQAMNGSCGYTPNQPAGSNFWFQVPCNSSREEIFPNHNAAQPEIDPVPRTTKQRTATKRLPMKALFVDDDRLAYFVVSRMFRRMGIELEGAFDGATGLSVLKASTAHCFSCVFMDLMMPRMGGDEAIKEFRIWESIHRVGQRRQAICILSGSDQFHSQYQGLDADFMLSKPCEAARMKTIIEQVMCDTSWPNVLPLSGAGRNHSPAAESACDRMPPPFLAEPVEMRAATPLRARKRLSTKRKAAGPAQQTAEVAPVAMRTRRAKTAKTMM